MAGNHGKIRIGASALLCLAIIGVAAVTHPPRAGAVSPAPAPAQGYWLVASDGGIFSFGNAGFHGSTGGVQLREPIVGMAADPRTGGYWLVASDGGVFSFGAPFYGSTGGDALRQPIVGMASTPDGGGYWLVAADGGVFSFGDAGFYGSTGGDHLRQPVVGMAATGDGMGYWLVAADGGIFSFGDAGFHGSTGGTALRRPVVGMAADVLTGGYWLVAADGGIFSFDAPFYGSTGGDRLVAPVVGISTTPDAAGYRLTASDGGVFSFGDAGFYGSTGGDHLRQPVVGVATTPPATSCSTAAPIGTPGVTPTQIAIGNIATINGPVPGMYASAQYGVEAYADYVNSTGGLCGRQLVVQHADDTYEASQNETETASLAPSVLGFVGSYSDVDSGGVPVLSSQDIPDIGVAVSPARFDLANNFSPVPQPTGIDLAPYVYLKSQAQYADATQHMALLAEDTPQAAAELSVIEPALKSVGYTFVFTDTDLQPTDPTFNGDIGKMREAGVTGLIFLGTPTIAGQLANQISAADLPLVFGDYSPLAYSPEFIENAGAGADSTVLNQFLALYDGQDAASVPMIATFDHWYGVADPGQVPDLYAAYGWLSGMLFAQGLEAGGSATRAGLLGGLHSITSFDGDGIVATDDPAAKTPPSCYLIVDVRSGQFARDAGDPSTGFDCTDAPDYYTPPAG